MKRSFLFSFVFILLCCCSVNGMHNEQSPIQKSPIKILDPRKMPLVSDRFIKEEGYHDREDFRLRAGSSRSRNRLKESNQEKK